MKVKDVLKLVCEYLREYDLIKIIEMGILDNVPNNQKTKIKVLMTSLNDVIQSLALMYFPLVNKEKLVSTNNKYEYSKFTKIVMEVVSVSDNNGNKIKFKCYPEYMLTKSNNIEVTYHYQPGFVSNFGDDLEVASERVSIRLLVTGTLARYYMYQGMFAESNAWEASFQRSVMSASKITKISKMPKRSWY